MAIEGAHKWKTGGKWSALDASPLKNDGKKVKHDDVVLGTGPRRETEMSHSGVGDERDVYFQAGGDSDLHGTATGDRTGIGRIQKRTQRVKGHTFNPGAKGANEHGYQPQWEDKENSSIVAGSDGWRYLDDGTRVVKEKSANEIKPRGGVVKNGRKITGSTKGLKRR